MLAQRYLTRFMAFYLRRTPLNNGRWRMIPLALKLVRGTLTGVGLKVIRTRHGFRMRVRLGDWAGQHLYVAGEYEPATTKLVKNILRRGDTFIDVGANIGYFSLLSASLVGPEGTVFAFEPVPAVRGDLRENLRLNQVANVTVREEAVSDAAGEVAFYVGPTDHPGTSSLRQLGNSSGTIRVRTERLDDLAPAGRRVRLIKIDVEGAECRALRGMEKLLRTDQPDLIIEVTDSFLNSMGDTAAGLCQYLLGLGYRMYRIDDHGLCAMDANTDNFPDQFNAFFTRRANTSLTVV